MDFGLEKEVIWIQNPQEVTLTTAMIGREVDYSTQQVRDSERLGVIPPAARGANGYRRYRSGHVVALQAYRSLAAAIGPVPARRIMPTLLSISIDEIAERIDELHSAIARDRVQVRKALRGLDAVLAESEVVFEEHDAMTIGELADALGVRASALRHWENEGLIHPDRDSISQARCYRARAITEARIVAALRFGGYPIPPILSVLVELRDHGRTTGARGLLDQRLSELTRRSVALLLAAAHLHALITLQASKSV